MRTQQPPLPLPCFHPHRIQQQPIHSKHTAPPSPPCASTTTTTTRAPPPGLLRYEDNGAQLDAAALLLLQRTAAAFPLTAKQLLQLGAEDVLRALRPACPPDLRHLLDSTLSALVCAPVVQVSGEVGYGLG